MTAGNYTGQGKVVEVPTSTRFELSGLNFTVSGTGTVVLNKINNINDDCTYLLLNLSNAALTSFSSNTTLYFEAASQSNFAYAYFDKPTIGLSIDDVRQVLSFQKINQPNFAGIGLIESYFREFKRVLEDPVMLLPVMFLPYAEFISFNFSEPVYLNTKDYNGLFYVNKITGYKGSHMPCEVELIKLP
jgi:hypothetical protein